MWLNSFSVRVPEGREENGYVVMEHDRRYTLSLRNSRDEDCDARVEIDSKHVGTWRISAHHNIVIERPANDTGHFTFYRARTIAAQKAGLDESNPSLGLIKVTFTPEKKVTYTFETPNSLPCAGPFNGDCYPLSSVGAKSEVSSTATYSYSAGGTGLSGRSNQQFTEVGPLNYDYSAQTVIHLRLVASDGNEPRPLMAFSTPVPPPVR